MTTWLSYFKQESDLGFLGAKAYRAGSMLLLKWLNSFLSKPMIQNLRVLMIIPPKEFKGMLAKILRIDPEQIMGKMAMDLIASSVNHHGVVLQKCTLQDVQRGDLFALHHYVTRLQRSCYQTKGGDILARLNEYAASPIKNVEEEFQSGDILIKLAKGLAPGQADDEVNNALETLETILELPKILDLKTARNLPPAVVMFYLVC